MIATDVLASLEVSRPQAVSFLSPPSFAEVILCIIILLCVSLAGDLITFYCFYKPHHRRGFQVTLIRLIRAVCRLVALLLPHAAATVVATPASFTVPSATSLVPMINKVHDFSQVMETILTLSSGTWAQIVLRLTNVFSEYFKIISIDTLFGVVERFFLKVRNMTRPNATASGLFADVGNALGRLDWIAGVTNWHNALRHLMSHLLALPFLDLETLIGDSSFLDLIDRVTIESLRKNSALVKVDHFIVVLKDFCLAIDAWIDPQEGDGAYLLNLASVQGWARSIEYLESMIGKRSRIPKAGFITYKEFNKKVLQCELRRNAFAVHGPYTMIVGEALRRLAAIKKAQLFCVHPDPSAPFVLAITGKTGTGKTELAMQMARHLMRMQSEFSQMTDEDLNSMVFSTTATTKWAFEGYNPERHYCYVADEVGTIMSSTNQVHPPLFKVMEHGTHQADQASVELKGRVPFNSKIIILLTNDLKFGLDSKPEDHGIYCRAAWFRRLCVHIDAVSLHAQFRSEAGPTCAMGRPQTVDIAQWHLMENTGDDKNVWPTPVCHGKNDPVLFDLTELISVIETRYAESLARSVRSQSLLKERFEYYRCKFPSEVDGQLKHKYTCDCCDRCDLCHKTEDCKGVAVCSTDCRWHESMATPLNVGVASALFCPSLRVFISMYGRLRGPAYWAVFQLQCKFIDCSPVTILGAAGHTIAAAMGAYSMYLGPIVYLFGFPLFSPFGLAISFTMALAMYSRPEQLSNATYDCIADVFEGLMAKLPIMAGMPLDQAYTVSTILKFGSAMFCGWSFSSMGTFIASCVTMAATGVPAFFPIMHFGFMGFYSFICLYGFWRNPRFFGRNSGVNDWYHSRRMRDLGLDPASVHAGFTLIITFVTSYALFKKFSKSATDDVDDIDTSITDEVVVTSSSQRPAIPFTVPYCDVYSTKESFWGSKVDSVTWPKSQVPLQALIDKVVANQVRLEIVSSGARSYVGGTMMHSNIVVTVYHAIKHLLEEKSHLTVKGLTNGEFVTRLDRTGFTTDGVHSLPPLTHHIDSTNDIVGLSLGGNASISLVKHVVRSFKSKAPFHAVVIHQTKEGVVHVTHGSARESTQTVVLDGSSDKLYTARFFDFTPVSDPHFESFPGICGGIMIAYTQNRCAIVGVLAATFTVERAGEIRRRVAALPINEAGVDFSKFGTAVPASYPEVLRTASTIPITIEEPFLSKHSHCKHIKDEGLLGDFYNTTEVVGIVPGSSVFPSSQTMFYEWQDDIWDEFPEFKHDKVTPIFRATRASDGTYISPGRHALSDMSQECRHPSIPYHTAAVQHIMDRTDTYKDIYDLYAPLDYRGDISTTFSGVEGSCIHTGIKRTTGAGFPWPGIKSDYFDFNADDSIKLKSDVCSHLDSLLLAYSRGERQGVITRGTYKDEPRSQSKVDERKIRMFAPAEFDKFMCDHVIRSSLVQIGVLARKQRMTLGGMSVFSDEWSELRTDRETSKPNNVLGDFSKFDHFSSHRCLYSARSIDLHFIHQGRWYDNNTPDAKRVFDSLYTTLGSDTADTLVIVDGELVRPGHGTSSGGTDTYHQNCVTHNIIAREAVLLIVQEVANNPATDWLSESVSPLRARSLATSLMSIPLDKRLATIMPNIDFITHGDDGLYAITDEYIPLFNFQSFKGAYGEMGMRFTPPDKTSRTYSHTDWDHVDIGKRKFRKDVELQSYTAPLDLESIGKMLTIGVVKDMSLSEKRECAVQDAIMEFAQYGRARYEDWTERLTPICEKWEVPVQFPDWLAAVTSNRSNRTYHVRGEDHTTNARLSKALATILGKAPETQALDNARPALISPQIM